MKHTEWKKFLIQRFLLILALVSLSERLISGLYDRIIFPWLSEAMQIDYFTAGMENGQTIGALCRGGLYLAVMGICGSFPEVWGLALRRFSEEWAGTFMTERISRQMAHMTQGQRKIFILGMIALTILILLTLLFPYAAAAVAFGKMVGAQMIKLEEHERLRQAEFDRRKNLLLSDVAHDLKTPMTTVAGYAKVLLEDEAPPKRPGNAEEKLLSREKKQEYLETIYNKSMQMSGLLNLLFDYVKLDSEGFQLKKNRLDLFELLREGVAGLYMDFEEKDMEIIPQIPEKELLIEADRVQLLRVVNNLLNNAVRHNPPQTRVWVIAIEEDEEAVICIGDDGERIPQQTARYIFDPFVLGDESRNSKNGSGLGLSIAKKIIAMHNGSLTLEQGEGEVYVKAFVIRLPL